MNATKDKPTTIMPGVFGLLIILAIHIVAIFLFVRSIQLRDGETPNIPLLILSLLIWTVAWLLSPGLFIVQPNDSRVLTLFGKYNGTVSQDGWHFVNPLTSKKRISLKIHNFNSERLKVNDHDGNPIEIASVIVWKVVDSAKAVFDVEDYEQFVQIQAETAIRSLASRYPYDGHEGQESLRGSTDEVSEELKIEINKRLELAGIEVIETRLSHLAYAQEIAQAMLRRQQAQAIIAARQKIVEGAVGMVKMALSQLKEEGVVDLDEDKKAQMVNNLLVALVSESEATPVINAGTVY